MDEAGHDGCRVNVNELSDVEPERIYIDAGEEVPELLRRRQGAHQVKVQLREAAGMHRNLLELWNCVPGDLGNLAGSALPAPLVHVVVHLVLQPSVGI